MVRELICIRECDQMVGLYVLIAAPRGLEVLQQSIWSMLLNDAGQFQFACANSFAIALSFWPGSFLGGSVRYLVTMVRINKVPVYLTAAG